MLLIAMSLSLLVIYAGATLLIRTRIEALTKFYKFISWFLILMGLFGTLYSGCALAMRCTGQSCIHHKKGHCMMNQKHHSSDPAFNRDSTKQMQRHGRCCPPVYCSAHTADYRDETFFYPKDCVCCFEKNAATERDTISE